MTRSTPNLLQLSLAALFGAIGAAGLMASRSAGSDKAPVETKPAATSLVEHGPDALARSFQKAARRVRPSVLNITTERSNDRRRGSFVRLLDLLEGPKPNRSYGTGFVVRADGVALTNHHVVAEAKRVLVRLHDGAEVSARVIGKDPLTDLAVLQLDPHPRGEDYVPVVFGDSDALEVGGWVLSAGNPFGLDQTVTAGIVSAKGRSRMGIAAYEDFIQTDAAINPGNSGGPLLDLRGRVVGVTTAIASRSGEYSGIGFAIPIGMARKVMDELLDERSEGLVRRGWLGVSVQEVSPEVLERLGFAQLRGALLGSVQKDSPAADAGLRAGDLIVAIDGQAIPDGQSLSYRVAEVEVGKRIKLKVVRSGRALDLEAEVVERPDTRAAREAARQAPHADPKAAAPVGISARTLSAELAQHFGFDFDPQTESVVIATVQRGSLAAQHGVRPGMVIQQVERQPIKTLDDLDAAVKASKVAGKGLLLRLWDGRTSHVILLR